VTWWWRIAARRDWGLQGWLKNRVYPDFLVRLDTHKQTARLLVLETKGKHMEGSADTTFKERFFRLLEEAYTIGKEAGELELFADAPDAMRFRILLQEEAWQNRVEAALA
jgi:type III restriction enzyme